jgi:hypothetical protein
LTVFEKDVGKFDISVNNVLLAEVVEPIVDIFKVRPDLLLGEGASFFEKLLQGSFFTKFGDEIAVVDAFEDLKATDAVGVVEHSGDGDLLVEQFF